MLSVADVVRLMALEPHPEGGFFREIFRSPQPPEGRGAMTSIYYMPPTDKPSRWRQIDADEVWSFHAGAPLSLYVSTDGETVQTFRMGTDFAAGEVAQAIVPAQAWARAESHGGWTLVGGTVAPGFLYEGFRMAPEGWSPGDALP